MRAQGLVTTLVQLQEYACAHDACSQFALKHAQHCRLYLDRIEFEEEVALYRKPELASVMPDLLQAHDNAAGAVRSRSGYAFPPFLVLERGTTLKKWLDEERNFFEVITMVEALARLLGSLHAAGYVHRDVKPENIVLLMQSTKWRMLDLGICARVGVHSTAKRLRANNVSTCMWHTCTHTLAPVNFRSGYALPHVVRAALRWHVLAHSAPVRSLQLYRAVSDLPVTHIAVLGYL